MAKVSLNELMGKAGGKSSTLSLKDLPDLLGEQMPDLPKNEVGKFRLMRALKIRFGNGFRNIPGVNGIMREFAEEVDFEHRINKIKNIKVEKKDG